MTFLINKLTYIEIPLYQSQIKQLVFNVCERINLGTIKNNLKCIVNYVNKIENVCGRPYCFRLDYSNTLYFSCKLSVFNKKN